MDKRPAISIVCPCFNHGRYIGEMLDSVKAQTFQDFEIIIVNDGSTDDTGYILNSLRYNKLAVIHTENQGPAAARNTAISSSRAPLIFNLDADDKIAPTLLEKAFSLLDADPELGIVTSELRFFGACSGRFELEPYSLPAMLMDNIIPSIAFFKRDDWLTVGGYSGEFVHGLEDYDFWLSIIELGRKVYRIPEDLVFYRRYKKLKDSRSGRRKGNRKNNLTASLTVFQRHEQLFRTCPEAYARMLARKEVMDNESFALQWIKQAYIFGRQLVSGRII